MRLGIATARSFENVDASVQAIADGRQSQLGHQVLRFAKQRREIAGAGPEVGGDEPDLLVRVRPAVPTRPEPIAEGLDVLERGELEDHDVVELEVKIIHAFRIAAGAGVPADAIASIGGVGLR